MIYPTIALVEGPPLCHDIFEDDVRQLHLDAMEIFSKLSIGDLRCTFSPLSESRWQPCYLCILDKRFHVMEGVEGFLIGAWGVLVEAIELGPMSEPVFVVSRETFPFELTFFL